MHPYIFIREMMVLPDLLDCLVKREPKDPSDLPDHQELPEKMVNKAMMEMTDWMETREHQ